MFRLKCWRVGRTSLLKECTYSDGLVGEGNSKMTKAGRLLIDTRSDKDRASAEDLNNELRVYKRASQHL